MPEEKKLTSKRRPIKEKEYYTISEAATFIGSKRQTVERRIKQFNIKTYQFNIDKRLYIAAADATKIRDYHNSPWLTGEREDSAAQVPMLPHATNQPEISYDSPGDLPEGTLHFRDFLALYNLKEHKDKIRGYLDRPNHGLKFYKFKKSNRRIEYERYLTSEQQDGLLAWLQVHHPEIIVPSTPPRITASITLDGKSYAPISTSLPVQAINSLHNAVVAGNNQWTLDEEKSTPESVVP